jgi:transcriptional regulator with XRE-family HTH domain
MSSERPISEAGQALGGAIAQARRSAGLTIGELAASAGLQPTAYEAIESGAQPPPLQTIVHVASALGLSVAELFERAGL